MEFFASVKPINDLRILAHTVLPIYPSSSIILCMREILIYCISGCASLVVLGYVTHIFIGGMVSEKTETIAIIITVFVGLSAMLWMAWDVVQTRKKQ